MCCHNCKYQTAEWDNYHGYYLRCDLPEKFLQIYQYERCQDCRQYLCLITDHIDLDKTEIPLRNICCCGSCYCICVQELSGNQCQTKNDSEHLCGSHLLGNGPADAYWQHMEDCLTDQPQKTVKSCPELTDITQCLGAVFKKVHTVDTVSKAQDQTTCDDRRDQWCKDLCQRCNNSLQYILVLLRRLLDCVLGNALHTGYFHCFDSFYISLGCVCQYEAHSCDTM